MTRKAVLIITHSNPDLDAIGFVYSARKVFGSKVPVECRVPTRQELEDPTVIVGDIGLPGCEDIGYSPTLNNFDHHYSHAGRSATFLFNDRYQGLRADIVEYIDAVDIRGGQEDSEVTLKVATVGIRVCHDGADLEILTQGGRLLQWLEETEQTASDISGTLPEEAQGYLQSGQEELRRIRSELATMQRCTTDKGRTVGYMVTASPVFSVVKEEMFALGLDIAVVYSTAKDRYSIASNVRGGKPINLKQEGLADALNAEEWSRGMPSDRKWDGHEDRIGSPRPSGSLLTGEEVLAIVKATL
jgi:hypothetical protein